MWIFYVGDIYLSVNNMRVSKVCELELFGFKIKVNYKVYKLIIG